MCLTPRHTMPNSLAYAYACPSVSAKAAQGEMVWFSCEDCGDSVKKPKLSSHQSRCSASRWTCLDCNATFDAYGAQAHTRCVTEHEKYALGVTKGVNSAQTTAKPDLPVGKSGGVRRPEADGSLATSPPWKCSVCNITCTSQETLSGHAAGAKHQRRVRARKAEQAKQDAPIASQELTCEGNALPTRAHTSGSTPAAEIAKAAPLADAAGDSKGSADATEETGKSLDPQKGRAKSVRSVKWKKLAAKELKPKGKLSLTKLKARVLKAAGLTTSAEAMKCLQHRLQSSSQFRIEAGKIFLSGK